MAEAAKAQVMLSMEIVDTAFMSNISRWLDLERKVCSPWFCVYRTLATSAWQNDVPEELRKGIHKITAIHLKDTQPFPRFAGAVSRCAIRDRLRRFYRDISYALGAELSRRLAD